MRAIVLTSTGLRHKYFANEMAKHFDIVAVFAEAKKNYYTAQRVESDSVQLHFEKLSKAEEKWFSLPACQNIPELQEVKNINSLGVLEQSLAFKADCICLFGTAILKPIWLNAFENRIINLHLGLSPYYRGSATLFWPFVYRELQYLGTTIHLAIEKVDAGALLHRVQPNLLVDEDYYAITNRLIRDSMEQMPKVITRYLEGHISPKPQESIEGSRLCKKADFNESALQKMLEYAGEGLKQSEIDQIMETRCQFWL